MFHYYTQSLFFHSSPPQVEIVVLRLSPNVLPWHEWKLTAGPSRSLQPSTSEADYGLWLTKMCDISSPIPSLTKLDYLYILTGPVDAAGMCVSK